MSAKYNQHPMEKKAEADIAATRNERAKIEQAYEHWIAWFRDSTEDEPTMFQLFQAGWINKPAVALEAATPALAEFVKKWLPLLREVAHKAFHLCDDSESIIHGNKEDIRVDKKQFRELCKALNDLGDEETHEALQEMDRELATTPPQKDGET